MRITALAGGVGGARFLRGLLHHLEHRSAADPSDAPTRITVIGNTGDDITLFGLRVCPDLDTILYTLGGGVHEGQGWGRADETHSVAAELASLGATPQWFTLGDKDFATHVYRSQLLGRGMPLSEVVARLSARWGLPELRRHAAAHDRHPGRDPRRRRGGRASSAPSTSRSGGSATRPPCRSTASSSPVSTRRRPHPACSRRSARPTSSCCPRATRSCRSASSSACRGCATPCAAPGRPSSASRRSSGGGRSAATPTPACARSGWRRRAPASRASTRTSSTAGSSTSSDPMQGRRPPATDARLEVEHRPLLMSSVGAAADLAGAALDLGLRLRDDRASRVTA